MRRNVAAERRKARTAKLKKRREVREQQEAVARVEASPDLIRARKEHERFEANLAWADEQFDEAAALAEADDSDLGHGWYASWWAGSTAFAHECGYMDVTGDDYWVGRCPRCGHTTPSYTPEAKSEDDLPF